MDTAHGTPAASLVALSHRIREYSIYQAIPLILEVLREIHPKADDESLHDFLLLHANPGLGFPGSDIERLELFEWRGKFHVRLCLNVISLVGSGSPLPAFYGEQVLDEEGDFSVTRDFLDVFHHRLQKLMLPVWRKYRYHAVFAHGATDRFSEHLFALIGLGGERIREAADLDWKRLLPYLGLLSLRAHSAALIESVLRYYFNHADFFIEQCAERVVHITREQRNFLGRNHSQLGQDAVLGERIRDRSGKFRIHIRRLCWDSFHKFLPQGASNQPLSALVRFTQRDFLEYDVCLALLREEIRALCIGEQNTCRLGWTSWLGHERADGMVTLGQSIH
ncbi:type VI secretion system baseplate subunit TssG [Pseudomonas sp. CDFA 610]|uniref:type VI secretion system baseplate subunit TssG n=1 Tax=Pseudomonas sp. CDFA 610 TaxID=2829825 RepID=UPI001E2882A5|nr:type VI secretion system baseplate subunit TssG [Pseudomonas sp. CDFA 610]MCD5984002.1 type VI secretion system baseplate subunit TssG [Pseudomonas sp. CDFA 610]